MIFNSSIWLDEIRELEAMSVNLDALSHFKMSTPLMYGGKGLQGSKFIVEKLNVIPNSKVELTRRFVRNCNKDHSNINVAHV
jgi:hypothetical protein